MELNELLFHELQLGNRLGKSVSDNRRSDFALMLALLSKDIREQSQFYLYETEQGEEKVTDERLRQELSVPQPSRLAVEDLKDLSEFDQASHTKTNYAHIRLCQALNPMPLALENDEKKISDEVLTNTNLETQERLKAHLPKDITLNDNIGFNVPKWLDSVAQARHAAA